jgi:hypothetical protein
MVSQHPPHQPPVMRMRLSPRAPQPPAGAVPVDPAEYTGPRIPVPVPPPWRFEVKAADGTLLLVMREENGRLVIEGDESRWDEGAKRFLYGVMQWSGQAGITWKDEARKTGEQR